MISDGNIRADWPSAYRIKRMLFDEPGPRQPATWGPVEGGWRFMDPIAQADACALLRRRTANAPWHGQRLRWEQQSDKLALMDEWLSLTRCSVAWGLEDSAGWRRGQPVIDLAIAASRSSDLRDGGFCAWQRQPTAELVPWVGTGMWRGDIDVVVARTAWADLHEFGSFLSVRDWKRPVELLAADAVIRRWHGLPTTIAGSFKPYTKTASRSFTSAKASA